ncbi:MAG: prepilin-type N-terminal cleavage/methylation domain-containing protein [Desulfobacterales bacterium]|nr:prepilin-type N-terminal cleavage/methylation domain-containing protein [Desulfobacterales bacterium]
MRNKNKQINNTNRDNTASDRCHPPSVIRSLSPVSCLLSPGNGFTLIELIMVMVLLAVLGTMGAGFISKLFIGFSASDARMEIYETGNLALTRIQREIRNSVPNTVKVETISQPNDRITFGLINEAAMEQNNCFGRYTEEQADFPTATLTDAAAAATPQVGWIISVYNRKWTDFNSGARLYRVTGTTPPAMAVDSQVNKSSPAGRYYLVDKAVRYRWDDTRQTIYRSWDQVDENGPGDFSTASEIPLAENVTAAEFTYSAGALGRSGMVSLKFTVVKNGQSVQFHKEFHIRNAP